MDTRDIVAATLAAAIFQRLTSPLRGESPEIIRGAKEASIQFAVQLYQEVLATLPPEPQATDQVS